MTEEEEQEVYKATLDIDGFPSVILRDKNGQILSDVRMQNNLLSYCLRTYRQLDTKWKKKFHESIKNNV